VKALALIDGEHYPDVVRAAFASLPYEVYGAVLLGGTEKLRSDRPDYGVPLYDSLEEGLAAGGAEVVVDLSDEPVVDPPRRFRLASRALAAGLPYEGADFRFDPVAFSPLDRPALAVIGSGKRVGKTAVAGHVVRLLSRSREVVVVAMGRGGPPEPVVTEASPTLADLLALSRAGAHAASDYLEDAALAGVVTVGARRCGGGLAGRPFFSNVEEAARLAASLEPDLVLLEGSGAAIPPVEARARILVAGAHQEPDVVAGYLGAYRLLLSDLVLLTMAEEPLAAEEKVAALRAAIAAIRPELPVVATVLRPRPVEPVAGRRVAFFSTAPAAIHDRLREQLEREHGAEVTLVSGNLARRDELRRELGSPAARSADVFLVEIKAAAIDVVAEAAAASGTPVVFSDNDVIALPGEASLDERILALADVAVAEGVTA
jgi:cyclic 2,3-diphosphoglycerate synthetase